MQSELDLLRQTDKKQKIRIKQLEKDLEGALKKTTGKGVTDRLYSGSRLASPASSVGKRSISVPQRKGNFSRENSISSEVFIYINYLYFNFLFYLLGRMEKKIQWYFEQKYTKKTFK